MTKKADTKEVTVKEVKVPDPVKRLIGEPGVIAIGGVILEPIATVKKERGPVIYNGITLVDHNFTSAEGETNPVLHIYAFTLTKDAARGTPLINKRGVDLFIVADELSSLDIETPNYTLFTEEKYAVLTMFNSRSKNDYFAGDVLLHCVDSQDNSFENSTIDVNKFFYGRRRVEYGPKLLNEPKSLREEIRDVQCEGLTFTGRQLPPGYYRNSELWENSFIRGERDEDKRVLITDSSVSWSNFREGAIEIRDASVDRCHFHLTGNVKLAKITLEAEYFGDNLQGVYLTSKYDLTAIDMTNGQPARMIRVDLDNVVITLPPSREEFLSGNGQARKLLTMSFRNPYTRRALRTKTYDMLFGDNAPSETEESVADYFLDTVQSRCSMMNLMDTAQRLLAGNLIGAKDRKEKEVGPLSFSGRPLSEFDIARDRTNNNDNTIYIDGKNFNS